MIGRCVRASCRAPAGSPGPDDRTLTVRFCLCCKPRIHQTLFHPSLQRPLSHPATNAGFYHQPAARSNRILGNESSEKMNCCHCADAVCWWRWPSLTLMVYRSNIWVSWNQARGCGPLSNYANTCCVSEAHPAQPELFRLFSSSLPVHHRALWPEAVHTVVQDWSSAAATCPRVHCARSPDPSLWFMGTEKPPRSGLPRSALRVFEIFTSAPPTAQTLTRYTPQAEQMKRGTCGCRRTAGSSCR